MKRVLMLAFFVAGCGSDEPLTPVADVPIGDVSEEAEATELDVVVLPTFGPRAYRITEDHADELNGGPLDGARVGDYVIRNDHVRFVVRDGDRGSWLAGTGGGGLVDVGEVGEEQVLEILPIVGLTTFVGAPTITVVENGVNGVAEIQLRGPGAAPEVINSYLPTAPLDGELVQTLRLEQGARALEMVTGMEGDGTEGLLMGTVVVLGGEVPPRIREADGWLASEGESINYGLVSSHEMDALDIAGLNLILGPTLEPPAEWTQWLVVGDGPMSSVIDAMILLRQSPHGTVAGTVSDPTAQVSVRDAGGELVTRFRPDANGAFEGLVPPGMMTLTAEGPGRATGAPVELDVTDGSTHDGLVVDARPPGVLRVTLTHPARIDVRGGSVQILAPLGPGEHDVPVPPGTYTATASRGFEYEMAQLEIVVPEGGSVDWTPTIERSVDTTGWLAADFHLHSEFSLDSNVPLADRIVACAAEGVEYAVSTDHDVVTDYSRSVPDAVAPFIEVSSGIEVSTARFGHINVWPLTRDPDATGGGAFEWHGLEFAEVIDLLAPETPGRVVQVNHGREDNGMATFDAIDFEPEAPDPALLADMRFNAMEIFNGSAAEFDVLLADWLALAEAGQPVAGTGVSDSHSIGALCGHARTMVRVEGEVGNVDTEAIDEAVVARQTMVTSGPFVTVEGAGAGAVAIKIQAPTWMPVDRMRVYADGVLDQEITIEPSDAVVRYDQVVTLQAAAAARVAVVVEADEPASPMQRRKVRAVSTLLSL